MTGRMEVQAPFLSWANCLGKSVLASTTFYSMQYSGLLPSTLCNDIDKRIQKYLWGSLQNKWKVYVASWDVVMAGNEHGGLGIRSMKQMNLTFMA